MPDHFHGLLQLSDNAPLGKVIADLKGRSSFLLRQDFYLNTRLWQLSYFDRALRFEDDRLNIARYIVVNPVRAGLVPRVGDYPFWNCIYF